MITHQLRELEPALAHAHTQPPRDADAQTHTDLPAPGGQSWVPANPALEVELALPVPAEVDGAGRDVDVHEVIHDAALDVVGHSVHCVALPHVHDLDVGQIPFQREGRERPVSATRALEGTSCRAQEPAADPRLSDHQAGHHNTQGRQPVCEWWG